MSCSHIIVIYSALVTVAARDWVIPDRERRAWSTLQVSSEPANHSIRTHYDAMCQRGNTLKSCDDGIVQCRCIQEFFRSGKVDTRTSNTGAASALKVQSEHYQHAYVLMPALHSGKGPKPSLPSNTLHRPAQPEDLGLSISLQVCFVQTKIQNFPQEVMKRRTCPVGRDKASTDKEVKPCTGMVCPLSLHSLCCMPCLADALTIIALYR